MDVVMKSDYYDNILACTDVPELNSSYKRVLDDIQTYCRELKCQKNPTKFVEYLQKQFVFEMLLDTLESLLLDEPVVVKIGSIENPEVEIETQPGEDTATRNLKEGSALWKPFYLDQGTDHSNFHGNFEAKVTDSIHYFLGGRLLQLWLGLIEVCGKLDVSAVYYDEIKRHVLDPRFLAIVERWLYEPTQSHIAAHYEICEALVALLVSLHNHAYFDANCYYQSGSPSKRPSIRTCLTSFFHVISKLPKTNDIAAKFSPWFLEIKNVSSECQLPQPSSEYEIKLAPHKFQTCEFDQEYFDSVKTMHPNISKVTLPGAMRRLNQELVSLPENLPLHMDSMIAIRVDEDRPQHMSVLITGPRMTPYDSGCFVFNLVVPGNYPQVPPAVQFMTTGYGSVRFSPNLYDCGKVCLSLLGTWEGDPWNPMTSTILQVLVSIQGAILGAELPYYNEPGREVEWGRPQGLRAARVDENGGLEPLRLGTIEYAWTDMINFPPHGFEELVAEHFWLKRLHILETIKLWLTEGKVSDTKGYYENLCAKVKAHFEDHLALVKLKGTSDELEEFQGRIETIEKNFFDESRSKPVDDP